jgi:transcriptional/translational regulatory protein YebC/TACO1
MASAQVTLVPTSNVPVDAATGRKILALLEALDEHDDVQNVYANFELPPALLAEMS